MQIRGRLEMISYHHFKYGLTMYTWNGLQEVTLLPLTKLPYWLLKIQITRLLTIYTIYWNEDGNPPDMPTSTLETLIPTTPYEDMNLMASSKNHLVYVVVHINHTPTSQDWGYFLLCKIEERIYNRTKMADTVQSYSQLVSLLPLF